MMPLHPETFIGYALAVVFGFAFGFVLERAGFGSATKLAAQFTLRDMTVLKVMFSAIVTALLGLTVLRGTGLLDMEALYVNPTFLGAQVAGGVLFGVGFVVGGYCPGTAIVAGASGRLDGLAFLGGIGAGVLVYAASFDRVRAFATAGGERRLLDDWLGLPYGLVAVGVVVMALGMFAGAEWIERRMAGGRT